MKLGTQVGLGPGHNVLDGDPAPLPKKETEAPIFGPFLLWPNAGCIDMPLGMEVGLVPGYTMLDGDPAVPPKGGTAGSPNGWMDQDATNWYGGRPRLRRHCVRQLPHPQKRHSPSEFSAHVYCGQMAVCIGYNLVRGRPQPRPHCVRWGPSSPSPKEAQPPIFGQCPLWSNGWMD